MKVVPREAEKLSLHNAGYLAQKRLARGLRLNHPEAAALIATQVCAAFCFPHFSPKFDHRLVMGFVKETFFCLICLCFGRFWSLFVMVTNLWQT